MFLKTRNGNDSKNFYIGGKYIYIYIYIHSIVKPTHAHYQFLFIKTYLKLLKTLLHVSVIRPSSERF